MNKTLSILTVNLGNGGGEVVVFLRHRVTGVVGRQFNENCIVYIAPLGMVIGRLRSEGHFRHEGESLTEIFELKLRLEGIVLFSEDHGFGVEPENCDEGTDIKDLYCLLYIYKPFFQHLLFYLSTPFKP